jgi:hypothetical protein
LLLIAASLFFAAAISCAQDEGGAPIRITNSTLADGSKQVTKVDPSNHIAEIATYTTGDKLKNKIVYQINDEGVWISGVVYDGKKNVIMQATYKYDATGRMAEEKQFTKEGQYFRRLVYRYDPTGKLAGIDAFDANDTPIDNRAAATPRKSKRP